MTVGPMRARYPCYTDDYPDAQTAKDVDRVLEVVAPEALLAY